MGQRVKELEKAWCEFWVSSAVSFVPWSRKHEKAVVSRKTSAFQLWEDSKPTNGDANKAEWSMVKWSSGVKRWSGGASVRSLKSSRVRNPVGIQPRDPPCLDKQCKGCDSPKTCTKYRCSKTSAWMLQVNESWRCVCQNDFAFLYTEPLQSLDLFFAVQGRLAVQDAEVAVKAFFWGHSLQRLMNVESHSSHL